MRGMLKVVKVIVSVHVRNDRHVTTELGQNLFRKLNGVIMLHLFGCLTVVGRERDDFFDLVDHDVPFR